MANLVLRIKEFIDFKHISVSAFEKSIGMSNASFGKSLKNNGAIGSDKIEKILNVYPDICPIWLLTGEGNMLKIDGENTPACTREQKEIKVIGTQNTKGLPYFDKDMVENCGSELENAPCLSIDDYFNQHADLYCTCCEHSMSPCIKYGDILALKEVRVEDILFGEVYAVLMERERFIRQIKSNPDTHSLTFIPYNSDFEPQIFKKTSIRKVFRVVGSIHRFT